MESTELLRPDLAASECAADAIRNTEADTADVSAMSKAEIIAELENMVAARLFSGQPWLADRETNSAVHRKLIEMGLVEQNVEAQTWRHSPLGEELDVDLFEVFMGLWYEWDVVMILEDYHLIDEAEADALYARMARMGEADTESFLIGYVKRAYLDYRKASKSLH